MSRVFVVWLDSGANAQSCYRQEVSLGDIGIDDAKWDAMTDEERDSVMRDVAWDKMDWGYREKDGDDE